jgi:hypothetical protein
MGGKQQGVRCDDAQDVHDGTHGVNATTVVSNVVVPSYQSLGGIALPTGVGRKTAQSTQTSDIGAFQLYSKFSMEMLGIVPTSGQGRSWHNPG